LRTELVLAGIAAGLTVVTAVTVIVGLGLAYFLPNLLLLAAVGLVAVTLDTAPRSRLWGLATWAAAGGIAGVGMYGGVGYYFPQLWGPVLGFAGAGLLADISRLRWPVLTIAHVSLAVAAAVGHYFLVTLQIALMGEPH